MPVNSVNANCGGYYNNPYYDYSRSGRQYQNYGTNNGYQNPYMQPEKKSGSVFGKVMLGTLLAATSAVGLAVLHKRFDFLPKGGKIEQAAKWITDHCQKWAEMGKDKLVEKFPDGANPQDTSKIAQWGKKALNGIAEFFKKEGK